MDFNFYISFNSDLINLTPKQIKNHYQEIGHKESRIISYDSFTKYNHNFNYYYFKCKYNHLLETYFRTFNISNPDIKKLNICLIYCYLQKKQDKKYYGILNNSSYIYFLDFFRNYYSNLFNPAYYLNKYPDLKILNTKEKLLNHWINHGIFEGRDGSPQYIKTKINFEYYFYKNPDLKKNCINNIEKAFQHYIKNGENEKREINFFEKIKDIDIEFYKLF
jgi:hypothetical protein